MSLAYLNKDKDIPHDYREMLTGTEKPLRAAIKIDQEHDNATLGEWYTVAASLADAGLPADLIDHPHRRRRLQRTGPRQDPVRRGGRPALGRLRRGRQGALLLRAQAQPHRRAGLHPS